MTTAAHRLLITLDQLQLTCAYGQWPASLGNLRCTLPCGSTYMNYMNPSRRTAIYAGPEEASEREKCTRRWQPERLNEQKLGHQECFRCMGSVEAPRKAADLDACTQLDKSLLIKTHQSIRAVQNKHQHGSCCHSALWPQTPARLIRATAQKCTDGSTFIVLAHQKLSAPMHSLLLHVPVRPSIRRHPGL